MYEMLTDTITHQIGLLHSVVSTLLNTNAAGVGAVGGLNKMNNTL